MNETCPGNEVLLLYTEGELGAAEADEVSRHIARCRDCERAASSLRALTAALRRGRLDVQAARAGGSSASSCRECPDEELIAAYADGSLGAPAATEIERHLVSCVSCLAEVADLRAMSGPSLHDAPDSAVAAVLARLGRDSRTAVLRWARRSVELVRDFASGLAEDAARGPARALAAAASRSEDREVRVRWSGGAAMLEGIARAEDGGVSLTGRVTVGGAPAVTTSVALASSQGARGPESLDPEGRFGPWMLSPGENRLRLTGLPAEAGGTVELVIRLEAPLPEER